LSKKTSLRDDTSDQQFEDQRIYNKNSNHAPNYIKYPENGYSIDVNKALDAMHEKKRQIKEELMSLNIQKFCATYINILDSYIISDKYNTFHSIKEVSDYMKERIK